MRLTLQLAVRGLRRHWVMSALMVLGLSLGIAVYVTAHASLRAFSAGQPARLSRLVHVEIDRGYRAAPPLDEPRMFSFAERANLLLSWRDAEALDPPGQTEPLVGRVIATRAQLVAGGARRETITRFATPAFVRLFELAVVEGAAFGDAPAGAVWVEAALVERWSAAGLAVGRTLTVEGQPRTIAGVIDVDRSHAPMFELPWFSEPGVFVPLDDFTTLRAPPIDRLSWGPDAPTFEALLAADDPFVHVWARVTDDDQRHTLAARAAPSLAAHPDRALVLRPLAEWHARTALPHPAFALFEVFSRVALLAAALGLSRLLLAQFAARRAEVGLRRALGAPPGAILAEHLCEAGLLGGLGGLCGVALGRLGLLWMSAILPYETIQFALSWPRALEGVGLGVAAALVAGLLPALDAMRTPPARAMGRW